MIKQYNRMIENAPIIEENGKLVHLSDFVNDIFYNKDARYRKQDAMDDFEAIINYINKIEKELHILEIIKNNYDRNSLILTMGNYISFLLDKSNPDYDMIKEWLNNETK